MAKLPRRVSAVFDAALIVLLVGTMALAQRTLAGPAEPPAPSEKWHLQLYSGGALSEPAAQQAAAALAWTVSARVTPDTGISRAPAGVKPLAVAVRDGDVDVDDDMILVQGGEADSAATPAEFEVAVIHLIDWLVAYAPVDSIIVVAGPIPPPGAPNAGLLRRNHVMRYAARQRQVRYIDAFELHWNARMDLAEPLEAQLLAASKPRTFPRPVPAPSPRVASAPSSR